MTKKACRQGDVLVVPVDALPRLKSRLKPIGDSLGVPNKGPVILAYGEATGHHHGINRGAVMFRDDGGSGGTFIKVSRNADPLTHQEHSALKVAPGVNRVLRQRTMRAGLAKRVID